MLSSRYTRPSIFSSFDHLIAAESTRNGGVSPPPYASLNLGLLTNDSLDNVASNRQLLCSDLKISEEQLVSSNQIHGDKILFAGQPGHYRGYDAMITTKPDIFLSVKTADCVPVLIFDPVNGVIAAIHSGWRGTVKGIVKKTALTMVDKFNTNPSDCLVYIGTCIDECDYEVDADVADHFAPPFRHWDEKKNKFFIDLKSANKHLLIEAGVPEDRIEVSPFSTFRHNSDYFSHRKENGITGRMMTIIGMKS